MELSFRTLYSITTLIALLWFGNSLRQHAINDWTYEQKWMLILLVLLFLYDGPLYSAAMLFNGWICEFLDALFQITFLAALALFNICIFHALRQNERRFGSFYLGKLLIVGSQWVLALMLAYQTTNEYVDFTYSSLIDWPPYQMVSLLWFIFAGMYLINLIFSMIHSYSDLRTLSFFDKRLKFATSNAAVLLSTAGCSWIFHYGLTTFTHDIHVAQATLATDYHPTSASFMALYGVLNIYTYVMTFVYSASQKSVFENIVMKDNPAVSMMDDSDDEGLTSRTVKMDSATTKLLLNTSDEETDLSKTLFSRSPNTMSIKSHNDDSD